MWRDALFTSTIRSLRASFLKLTFSFRHIECDRMARERNDGNGHYDSDHRLNPALPHAPDGAVEFAGFKDVRHYLVELSDYIQCDTLGQGTFGKVWKGQSRITGWAVAVKELLATKLEGDELGFFQREIQILMDCDDPFLLDFVGFTNTPPYSILTAFIPCGSLWDILHGRRITLTGTQRTNIALGIAHGMKYLHAHRIIHRDMKSPNILLDSRFLPKIADFGLGRFLDDVAAASHITGNLGTPMWMAPEIIENKPYGIAVDVYAYGIILWEIWTEKIPFDGNDRIQVFTKVATQGLRPELPDPNCALGQLVQQCWDRDPERRPTFDDIYKQFESHAVSFSGCDASAVDALVHEIHQFENIAQNAISTAADDINAVIALRASGMNKASISAALVKAAVAGDVYRITLLIGAFLNHADVNASDQTGLSPLHAAARSGQVLVVQYLLTLGSVDPNLVDPDGFTPLMAAVRFQQNRVVRLLVLAKGVNVNQQDTRGCTALHLATRIERNAQREVLAELAKCPAIETDIADATGKRPFDGAPELAQFFTTKQREAVEKARA
jgi:serine/threonine protein kinase